MVTDNYSGSSFPFIFSFIQELSLQRVFWLTHLYVGFPQSRTSWNGSQIRIPSEQADFCIWYLQMFSNPEYFKSLGVQISVNVYLIGSRESFVLVIILFWRFLMIFKRDAESSPV